MAAALFAALAVPSSSLAAPPDRWPSFQAGLGAEVPLTGFVGGGIVPTAQARFLIDRGFIIANLAYTATKIEEKGNEDIGTGHDFIFAAKGGYNLIGDYDAHIGLGGGFGIHALAPPAGDTGTAIEIILGVFPEVFIVEHFALTGFIGMALEFYSKDATSREFNIADHSMFRFRFGQGTAVLTMGFAYYF
jgi:hypothetical protein